MPFVSLKCVTVAPEKLKFQQVKVQRPLGSVSEPCPSRQAGTVSAVSGRSETAQVQSQA